MAIAFFIWSYVIKIAFSIQRQFKTGGTIKPHTHHDKRDRIKQKLKGLSPVSDRIQSLLLI
jgi:hypothetical protein